ncbi:TPA: fimbrial biogenesis outer membrane usher protein [Escherichia coli]|nr:fimbrial biogenesis outer membrane usher protein [Escherichia coli]
MNNRFPTFFFITILSTFPCAAEEFDSAFLVSTDGRDDDLIKLDYFLSNNGLVPGEYVVDVYINNILVEQGANIFFSASKGKLIPQLTLEKMNLWGVKLPRTDNKKNSFTDIFPEGGFDFKVNKSLLLLRIPQKFLSAPDWLNTPSYLWNDGVPSLLIGYSYSGYEQKINDYRYNSQYLNFQSSLNFSGWRFRNDGYWINNSSSGDEWQLNKSFLRHDYSMLQGGQFTIGQTTTSGDIFDPFYFRGIQFYSDDGMINPAMQNYSPVIRGVAYSQSMVTVKLQGSIIYQKSVPPGPFEINDLSVTDSGSDMQIEIRESDGRVRSYNQALANLPILQREGRMRYNIALGQYYSQKYKNNSSDNSNFLQTAFALGLPYDLTIYNGGIVANDYYAILFGTGLYSNIWGALSFDITKSHSSFPYLGTNKEGLKYGVKFSRSLSNYNTYLTFNAYKYDLEGFYDYSEFQELKYSSRKLLDNLESHYSVSLNQPLDELGQVNLYASNYNYRHVNDVSSLLISYSLPLTYASASLSLGYSTGGYYVKPDKTAYLSVAVPLQNLFDSQRLNIMLNSSFNNSRVQQQVGVSGSSKDGTLSYSVNGSLKTKNRDRIGATNIYYRGAYSTLSGGYSFAKDIKQWNYGMQGGIALHSKGVTFSGPLNVDYGAALVSTNGISGIKIKNGAELQTDWRGFAVVPNLVPYSRRAISTNIDNIPPNVELINTDATVVPSRGALVPVSFKAVTGNRALITLSIGDNKLVPFGSIVTLSSSEENKANSWIVADQGQVYISGLPDNGLLFVKWGNSSKQQCHAAYNLTPKDKEMELPELFLKCN